MPVSDELLDDVKNYLDITWPDDEGITKLRGIIIRGMAYIDRIAGKEQDYSKEGKHRELLFDYCRYVRDDALDLFQTNYLNELLSFQLDCEVKNASSR